jgi:hypothetical protein
MLHAKTNVYTGKIPQQITRHSGFDMRRLGFLIEDNKNHIPNADDASHTLLETKSHVESLNTADVSHCELMF